VLVKGLELYSSGTDVADTATGCAEPLCRLKLRKRKIFRSRSCSQEWHLVKKLKRS